MCDRKGDGLMTTSCFQQWGNSKLVNTFLGNGMFVGISEI